MQCSVYAAVIMEAMRNSWTDDRLDDLNRRVESGFVRLENEMHRRFDEVDRRFSKVEAGMDRLNERFDKLMQGLLITGGGLVATLIATCAALVAGQV